ncbi:dynamin family protein [Virgibacillus sp. LDC-1]|uniref:dynamin family protein n=1 Tax=Virgibacillus sp. LDC-1 TaxID=3039856 RepID=UPI0024DE1F37|nr:dynamin family protein [Virgibacillus sp. LDC-1]
MRTPQNQNLKIDTTQITALYHTLQDHNDVENAAKLMELFEKVQKDEMVIAFAGHFSAGKSSMINALLEKNILPYSPVPTSANIVKVTSGEGVARVYFKHESTYEYKEPYDIDALKAYCTTKDTIQQIEISLSSALLPPRTALIDTPGIDAADDADRVITESSLHLVDMLFYVMDYNHVQSEVNLVFLQQIQEMGIPFNIIVNQVDKHEEKELAFHTFHERVTETFQQWSISPQMIYYCSLKDMDHPQNQFQMIKERLFHLLKEDRTSILRTSSSFQQIVHAHKEKLKQEFAEQQSEIASSSENKAGLIEKLKKTEDDMNRIKELPAVFESAFSQDMNTTLQNAYIMPAELRDLANQFLASLQKDFRVGLFGAKRKTEEEKQARLQSFLEAFQQVVESNIQWKLRDKFTALIKQYPIHDQSILNELQQFSIDVTEEDLFKVIKPGAELNGSYLLNYTNELAANIKQRYKQLSWRILEQMKTALQANQATELRKSEDIKQALEAELISKQKEVDLENDLQSAMAAIDQCLVAPDVTDDQIWSLKSAIETNRAPVVKGELEAAVMEQPTERSREALSNQKKPTSIHTIEQVLPIMEHTEKSVEGLPGFETVLRDLQDKKERLENRAITIALFGAFSAGKSSFANALLGEKILPSSPNPTTAVITRICPVTHTKPHGTVVLTLKGEQTLIDDLEVMLGERLPKANSFKALLHQVKEEVLPNHTIEPIYATYIHALIQGYEQFHMHIGKTTTVSLDAFQDVVTNEAKACYIEEIDLFYDCALTRQGITIVDTPGADSINARHTNVAFNYIKYADVILYITYYNHALAKADKEFLLQLGRVKEAFQLDKMFFIINAADLALHTADLEMVSNYVEEQLQLLGIRLPRIYPVSSKHSLQDKLDSKQLNEKMATFEQDFHAFIHHDLAALMVNSALFEVQRIQTTLTQFIETATLSRQEKETYRKQLLQAQSDMEAVVSSHSITVYLKQLEQKIEKQLFYVQERLSIHFHDLFKDSFNPTTITDSGKAGRMGLEQALKSLLKDTSYTLLQEARAVSLRVEKYIREQLNDVKQELTTRIATIDERFVLPDYPVIEINTPVYEQAFQHLELAHFQKALSFFKGTKAFFVHNEKENVKEAIYEKLTPAIQEYLERISQDMYTSYETQWEQIFSAYRQKAVTELAAYVDNHLSVMGDGVDVTKLQQRKQQLDQIIPSEMMEVNENEAEHTIN